MSDHKNDDDHDPLEAALRQLMPTRPAFGKDRLVFLAGQALGRRTRLRLAIFTALIGLGTGIVGAYVAMRAVGPTEITKVVVVHVPVPVEVAPPVPETHKAQQPQASPPLVNRTPSSAWDGVFQLGRPTRGYLQVREQTLRWGVEAMPTAALTAGDGTALRPTSLREMQAEMVGKASEF